MSSTEEFGDSSGNNNHSKGVKTNENGKTLSRNTVYAPLMAYEQTRVVPSKYMATMRKSIPKSIHETSLMNFLHDVSTDYHRRNVNTKHGRSNGSRPNDISNIVEYMKQKGVTVLKTSGNVNGGGGGGVTSSIVTHQQEEEENNNNSRNDSNRKKRKRPRKEWKTMHKENGVSSSGSSSGGGNKNFNNHSNKKKQRCLPAVEKMPSNCVHSSDIASGIFFIKKLNSAWENYIIDLLYLPPEGGNTTKSENENNSFNNNSTNEVHLLEFIKSRFIARRNDVEFIGASVRVETCKQKNNLAGSCGVLIRETENTWTVVMTSTTCTGNSINTHVDTCTGTAIRQKTATSGPSQVVSETVEKSNMAAVGCNNKNKNNKTSSLSSFQTHPLTIPKRGSTLVVTIPVDTVMTRTTVSRTKEVNRTSKSFVEITLGCL